jgi:hypothetical protein
MNQSLGSICSWEELCARFMANFASAYQRHGVEAHLHAVRQEPGETLRAFISHFTKVHGTIPRISDASIITAFLSHPVLEGKPNANHVRARIGNSRTQQLHNMDIITQCSNSIKKGNSRLHHMSETSI